MRHIESRPLSWTTLLGLYGYASVDKASVLDLRVIRTGAGGRSACDGAGEGGKKIGKNARNPRHASSTA